MCGLCFPLLVLVDLSILHSVFMSFFHTFPMQAMPILKLLYPNHWLFVDHPLYSVENVCDWTVHDERWEAWCRLVIMVFASAVEHEDQFFRDQLSDAMPMWMPNSHMKLLAKRLGATWLHDRAIKGKDLDPAAEIARDVLLKLEKVWDLLVIFLFQGEETVCHVD